MSGAAPVQVTIDAGTADQRLDRLLRRLLPELPLSAVFRLLRSGRIRVDGKKADGALRLVVGMVVEIRAHVTVAAAPARLAPPAAKDPLATKALPAALRPKVVYCDEHLLVVDKPAGLAAQPGTGRDGSNLVEWVRAAFPQVLTATFQPAPAHRLDAGTSGLVAIGLSPAGARGLGAAFREDRVHKVYYAVVHGVPIVGVGSIDAPLRLVEAASAAQPKVVVDPAGSPARTSYEVVRRGPSTSLLRLVLHTGRTHQIRAHLRHLGHPILGDRRYGSSKDLGRRFLLHAGELELPHPVTGAAVQCRAELPAGFWRDSAGGSR